MKPRLLACLCLTALASLSTASAAEVEPTQAVMVHPYPADFQQWKLLKETSLDPKNPRTAKLRDAHFVYANALALEGLRTGTYAEGAVFVLDILSVEHKDGVATLGPRLSTSTMVWDAKFAQTGGWAFVDYDIATHASMKETNPVRDCFECHTQKADRHYVFTELRP